jgi:beta-lactamase superfamily II metal-dependent hydrolase
MKFRTFPFLMLLVAFHLPVLAGQPQEESRRNITAHNLAGPLLEVHFLDVGQGDSMYVRTPGGKHYLIDTGPRSARKKIIPYLRYLKVEKLDGIFITHSHMDHMGALLYILKEFPVGKFYYPGYFHTSATNKKVAALLEQTKTEVHEMKRGDSVELDSGVTATALHPPTEGWEPFDDDLNNFSLVLRLTYGDVDFLLTGDSETKSEKEILKAKMVVRSEFLKIGHHGSKTATSEEFLDSVFPLYAVVSAGVNNSFGHPQAEVLKLLRDRDITILRTDESGTFGVYTDGKRIMIKMKGKDWLPVSWFIRTRMPGSSWLVTTTRGGMHA